MSIFKILATNTVNATNALMDKVRAEKKNNPIYSLTMPLYVGVGGFVLGCYEASQYGAAHGISDVGIAAKATYGATLGLLGGGLVLTGQAALMVTMASIKLIIETTKEVIKDSVLAPYGALRPTQVKNVQTISDELATSFKRRIGR
jgi:hypothetical protein